MKARNWRRWKQRRSQRRDQAMARYWCARKKLRGFWVWVAHSPIAVLFVIRRSDGDEQQRGGEAEK